MLTHQHLFAKLEILILCEVLMIKNRTIQVIYKTIYVTLGVIGIIGSLGYFDWEFNSTFYVFYTNLSNYICFGVILASLIVSVKAAKKHEDGFCTTAPNFKFLCVILILVTCLVYNFLLTGGKTASDYFGSLSNLLLHLILPIMFVLDWVLFNEHGKLKWYHPLLSTVMPLVYVVLIFIRAGIISACGLTSEVIYPYFFLNVETLGVGGLFMWLAILVAAFVALGYIIFGLDHIKRKKTEPKVEEKI